LPALIHQLLHFRSHIGWQHHRLPHLTILHTARVLIRVSGGHQHSSYTLLRARVLITITRWHCYWGLLHRTGMRCPF
jgi:hypothetical protein